LKDTRRRKFFPELLVTTEFTANGLEPGTLKVIVIKLHILMSRSI